MATLEDYVRKAMGETTAERYARKTGEFFSDSLFELRASIYQAAINSTGAAKQFPALFSISKTHAKITLKVDDALKAAKQFNEDWDLFKDARKEFKAKLKDAGVIDGLSIKTPNDMLKDTAKGIDIAAGMIARANRSLSENLIRDTKKYLKEVTGIKTEDDAKRVVKKVAALAAEVVSSADSFVTNVTAGTAFVASMAASTALYKANLTNDNALVRHVKATRREASAITKAFGRFFSLSKRAVKRKAKYTSKKVINGITRYFYD